MLVAALILTWVGPAGLIRHNPPTTKIRSKWTKQPESASLWHLNQSKPPFQISNLINLKVKRDGCDVNAIPPNFFSTHGDSYAAAGDQNMIFEPNPVFAKPGTTDELWPSLGGAFRV